MSTKIEWTHMPGYKGESWNVTAGCDKVSEGCKHCYAEKMAMRLKAMGLAQYQDVVDEKGWTGRITLVLSMLGKPLHWKKPRMIFVDSMSDLFHDNVPDLMLTEVMEIIKLCPRHIFIFLTKRAKNMAERLEKFQLPDNVWCMVTVENQKQADLRIPYLLQVNAAVRGVSVEPMLGPVDLEKYLQSGADGFPEELEREHDWLDWVICGGESGPGARPMHPDWVRSLRDQCHKYDVPFFFKQWGKWMPVSSQYDDDFGDYDLDRVAEYRHVVCMGTDGEIFSEYKDEKALYRCGYQPAPGAWFFANVGKKMAGRVLDWRTWDEFPNVSSGELFS